MLAKSLGRTFVDLDEEIVKTDGRSIPDIFAAEGEDGFRTKETAETQRFGKEGRQLISCGGGIVKKPENLRALHQNGIILFIGWPWAAAGRFLPAWTPCARWKHSAVRCIWQRQMPSFPTTARWTMPCMPPWRHWMKFLILNGPNLNIMRWSEPGVPGELDYNAIMDYVQAGCEQLGIETDCCQSNHEGDLVDEIQAAAGRVDGIVLNPGAYAHYSVAILDALRLCGVPAVEVMLHAPDEREPFRKTDVVSFGCQGHFIGEGPQGYLHACIYLAQLLRTDGSSKAHIVM